MTTVTETDTSSRLLQRERETLERLLPGLDAELARCPLDELEEPGGPALSLFREAGGPALLIPEKSEGLGASPLDAVDVQRAIGSRSPSLGIATTMHHFSVGTLVELAARESGLESLLLQAVARDQSLIASGFAEGQAGQSILAPTMSATKTSNGWRVSGSKKPCSLSGSMQLLTASVSLEGNGDGAMGVALIPADSPGVHRKPFWASWILRGAESDEVILEDVEIPDQLLFELDNSPEGGLDSLTSDGFVWFELVVAATYLGVASALLERAIDGEKGSRDARMDAAVDLEIAKAGLDAVACEMRDGARGEDLLARALTIRYGVQMAIARTTPTLVECLGGMNYIGSSDVAYLYGAARALAFHPPPRMRMAERLEGYLTGGELTVQ